MSQSVPNARLGCGTLYTTIFRLFQFRGPEHFPEEAEVRLNLYLSLSYLSRIPYRPLPSGAQNQSAEHHAVSAHKPGSGTDVALEVQSFCLSGLWGFQDRNCHFPAIMLGTAGMCLGTAPEPRQWMNTVNVGWWQEGHLHRNPTSQTSECNEAEKEAKEAFPPMTDPVVYFFLQLLYWYSKTKMSGVPCTSSYSYCSWKKVQQKMLHHACSRTCGCLDTDTNIVPVQFSPEIWHFSRWGRMCLQIDFWVYSSWKVLLIFWNVRLLLQEKWVHEIGPLLHSSIFKWAISDGRSPRSYSSLFAVMYGRHWPVTVVTGAHWLFTSTECPRQSPNSSILNNPGIQSL